MNLKPLLQASLGIPGLAFLPKTGEIGNEMPGGTGRVNNPHSPYRSNISHL